MATSDEIRTELEKTVGLLKTLRDEARVRVHLAGMDVKTAWNELQPKLDEAERLTARAAETATEATLTTVRETAHKLQQLVRSL